MVPGTVPSNLLLNVCMRFLESDNVKSREDPRHATPFATSLIVIGKVKASHPAMGVPISGLDGAIGEKDKRRGDKINNVKKEGMEMNVAREV